MRRLIGTFMAPFRRQVALAVVCMILMAAATAAIALLLEPAINQAFLGRDAAALWWVSGSILVAFMVRALGNYGQSLLITHVGLSMLSLARDRLYAHVSGMELRFFQRHPSGTLVSRFTYDINRLRSATLNAVTALGRDLVTLVALVVLVFYQDWVLAGLAFVVAPLTILPVRRLGKKVRRRARTTQEETGRLNALLSQILRGVRMVWIDGRTAYVRSRVDELVTRIFRRQVSGERARTLIAPIMELATGLALGLALYAGAQRVMSGATDPGGLTSMLAALLMAYQPAKRLANLYTFIQEGLASAERLFEVLDTPPDLTERPAARPLPRGAGTIALQGVRFSYAAEGPPVLRDISFDVPPGALVALVGPSGAGKSTLLNLIPRFLDADAGAVLVDGHDVRDVTLASLRARIALVTQETFLFDDTVRANLLYARPDASEAAVIDALRAADAEAFVARLPQGLDTPIGTLGGRLSGGERQRLAIARAILKDAPLLLLDEPTSALDTAAERRVQAALTRLSRARTTLVVAHRLSTVVDADRICVLQEGRLVEHGCHADLLAARGVYARLFAESGLDAVSNPVTPNAGVSSPP